MTPVNHRLNPSRFSDRFYVLTELRTRLQSIVERHLDGKRDLALVDFGCGEKPYRALFTPFVRHYIGIDLPDNPAANVYASVEGHVPLRDCAADVVLSTQVLEHVLNPSAYLQECHRILKPDGLLLLSTHGYWMYHPHPSDLWRWTGPGLRRTLDTSGYNVLECEGVMGLAASGIHLFQDGLMPWTPRPVRPVVAAIMQSLIGLADRLSSKADRANDACLFLVVASKMRREP